MELTPHVDRLRHELATLAQGADDAAQPIVDRLIATLDAPLRLVLLEALSSAADELTLELAPTSVDVRLRGPDAELVVTTPPATAGPSTPPGPPPQPAPEPPPDDGPTARITLRLPEGLKAGVEDAADAEHLSVNAWLVRLVSRALQSGASPDRSTGPSTVSDWVGQSFKGWAE